MNNQRSKNSGSFRFRSHFGLEFLSKNARDVLTKPFSRDTLLVSGVAAETAPEQKTLTIPSKSWRNAIKAQLDAFVRGDVGGYRRPRKPRSTRGKSYILVDSRGWKGTIVITRRAKQRIIDGLPAWERDALRHYCATNIFVTRRSPPVFVTFIKLLMLVTPGNPSKMLGEIKLRSNHIYRSSRFRNFRLRFFEISRQTKDRKTSREKWLNCLNWRI